MEKQQLHQGGNGAKNMMNLQQKVHPCLKVSLDAKVRGFPFELSHENLQPKQLNK